MSETEEVEDGDYESRSPSPNYWWPPSPKDDEDDVDDEEDEDSDEDYEDEDYEDEGSDDQHRQHNAFWKGFRAAIKGYASSSSSEGEEEDDEGGVHRDRWNDKDDEEDSDEEDEDLPHLDGYLEGYTGISICHFPLFFRTTKI